jgi:hypothetical protein
MNIPAGYKRIGPGLYFSEKERKVKLLVKRPKKFGGFGGHRPWSITLVVENRNDALQKGYEFRNACLRLGHKPGEHIAPGPFDSMPTFREYLDRYWPDREHPIGNPSPKVRRDQWCITRKSLIPAFGDLHLDRIHRPDLAAFQSQRIAAGASPYTINATAGHEEDHPRGPRPKGHPGAPQVPAQDPDGGRHYRRCWARNSFGERNPSEEWGAFSL